MTIIERPQRLIYVTLRVSTETIKGNFVILFITSRGSNRYGEAKYRTLEIYGGRRPDWDDHGPSPRVEPRNLEQFSNF